MKKHNYIYKITNLLNNKIYIGKHSTDNLEDGYMGSGVHIRRSQKKYGIENFTKEILAITDNENDLNVLEKLYIGMFNSTDTKIGYNKTYGGDGVIPTEETKMKMSESLKGRTFSDEHRRKLGESHKGHNVSEEARKKISEYQKGNKNNLGHRHTDETRKKMSESLKGRTFSEETRRKISEAKKGKGHKHTEESRKKMSEAHKGITTWMKGHKHTEESRKKMSESQKCHSVSDEARRKISESVRNYHKYKSIKDDVEPLYALF